MKKITKDNYSKIREEAMTASKSWIRVGMSTCGVAAGADEAFKVMSDAVKKLKLDVEIKRTGCLGMCHCEPLVEVSAGGLPTTLYCAVDKDTALKIVEEHVASGRLVQDHIFDFNTSE